MEVDSSSQATPGPVTCPPINGIHRSVDGDGSRLREMLEGVDKSLKRARPLDFVSSASEVFLDAPMALKRPRLDGPGISSAELAASAIADQLTRNSQPPNITYSDGAMPTQRHCDSKVNHLNDLNAAPIFRSVLFGESSSRFQHLNNSIVNPSSCSDNDLHIDTKTASHIDNHNFPSDNQLCTTISHTNPTVISSDPFHDLTGDLSLQVCTSTDDVLPANPDKQEMNEDGYEEEDAMPGGCRERRQSTRMATMKLSKKELQAERKRMREEEKEEKRKKREENKEKKRLKALEVAERKRLREEEKVRKAAELEERKKKRAIELEEKRKKKEAEEELKRRRKEEFQERLRQREEERRLQQEARAKDDANKKQKVQAKKRKKVAEEELEDGEDGWKKNAGLTTEDREKIPLGPMSGVERVFSWLFGKHSDNADLPPYLHINEDTNRVQQPQLLTAKVTMNESQNALKE